MNTPRALYVEWGFASFEIPWENVPDNIRKLLDEGVYFDGGVAMGISADLCGKSLSEILKEAPRHLIQYDLLLPENQETFHQIMNFLGLPENCTLDDFAARYGGISRQEYISLISKRSK